MFGVREVGVFMYDQRIRDHVRNPRRYGVVQDADITTRVVSPSCGDTLHYSVRICEDRIEDIAFEGAGSMLTMAAASMLAEYAYNKDLAHILALTPEDMLALVGLALGPTRAQHALFPLKVLQEGIKDYVGARTLSQSAQ